MKCICREKCFIESPKTGRNTRFNPGDVEEFEKCPGPFQPLELIDADKLDFVTASEAELLNTKWKFEDLAAVCEGAYGVELERTNKAEVVAKFIDARERHVPEDREPKAK